MFYQCVRFTCPWSSHKELNLRAILDYSMEAYRRLYCHFRKDRWVNFFVHKPNNGIRVRISSQPSAMTMLIKGTN